MIENVRLSRSGEALPFLATASTPFALGLHSSCSAACFVRSTSVMKRSGKLARGSPPLLTRCLGKLRSLVSAARFPLRDLLASCQGAFPESLCGTLRRALSLGFSQRVPLYGSR
jgi:hypothetical protein